MTVDIADGPTVSTRSIGRFRVHLHWQVDGGPWTPVADPSELTTGATTVVFDHDGPLAATRLALVLVDPG